MSQQHTLLHQQVLPAVVTRSTSKVWEHLARVWWGRGFNRKWGRLPFFKHCATPASVCRLSSQWLPMSEDHLGVDCDCVKAMSIPPGWPDPMPAKTDIATASAARTLSPLMVAPGLATEVGGDGPCWITAAGEPICSVEASWEVSSPPAARDRDRNIHP